jgi:prevent-host-death family protein
MRSVSAREANQAFSRLLGEAEGGEELVITRRGRPVAKLVPYQPPEMTPERKAALERAIERLRKGLPLGMTRPLTRDEMHER